MGSSKAGFNSNGLEEVFSIIRVIFGLKLGRLLGYW